MILTKPTRVLINQPSTLQTFHSLHGKVGIAIPTDTNGTARIYFCEGDVISQLILIDSLDEIQ